MAKKNNDVSGGLEVIIITNENYKQIKEAQALIDARKFLLTIYNKNKVISVDDAIDLLSEKKDGAYVNDAYRWMVIKEKDKITSKGKVITGKTVGVVTYDVWQVPENDDLHFTPLYYLTAEKGYEGAVNHHINTRVLPFAKKYSEDKGKRNIGYYTDETRNKKLLKGVIEQVGRGGYLYRKLGVPTLDNILEKDYIRLNFKIKNYVDLVFAPFDDKELTTPVAKKIASGFLDGGYNGKQPGDRGYVPLSEMSSYKKFAVDLDKEFPDGIVKLKPIR